MKRLPQERKYSGTIVSCLARKKADQLLPQKSPRETNRKFSAHWFHCTNGPTNSQANGQGYYQAKVGPASQQH